MFCQNRLLFERLLAPGPAEPPVGGNNVLNRVAGPGHTRTCDYEQNKSSDCTDSIQTYLLIHTHYSSIITNTNQQINSKYVLFQFKYLGYSTWHLSKEGGTRKEAIWLANWLRPILPNPTMAHLMLLQTVRADLTNVLVSWITDLFNLSRVSLARIMPLKNVIHIHRLI